MKMECVFMMVSFTKDYEKEKVVVLVEEGYWSIQVIGRRMKRLILM